MSSMFFLIGAVCFFVFTFRYIRESGERRKPLVFNMGFIMAALLLFILGTVQIHRATAEEENKKDTIITANLEKIEDLTDQKDEIESKMDETVGKLKQELTTLEENKAADVESAIKKAKEELDKQYQSTVQAAVDEAVAKMKTEYESKIAAAEAKAEEEEASSYTEAAELNTASNLEYDPFGPDLDCGDFSSQSSAQSVYEAAGGPSQDPHDLDRDNDGIACDAN
ncbi:excalibur calcium-binding domain-containing protein [Bacillus sp. M6-12]|uniref:excalibur calcium-binding domain-containing protein n=1 Tax=Bacillus sp. M6-12 TaxID=2054166 RepID=UPI001C60BDE4|nr:excalibur calcium-binding domain-containing protein [Bacillus sp. M6-12]